LLFLCGQFAWAAENNSTVEGLVQDASGKPVAGAFVKLKIRVRDIAGGKHTTQDTTTLEDFSVLARLREEEEG
jgi:hypothetical protein